MNCSYTEPTSGDSSDDEPLSELAKKINSESQRKLHIMPSKTVIPAMRSRKEKTAEKDMGDWEILKNFFFLKASKFKCVFIFCKDEETYSDSSDDKPLVKIKLKMATTGKARFYLIVLKV